jgi:hypothetical protein
VRERQGAARGRRPDPAGRQGRGRGQEEEEEEEEEEKEEVKEDEISKEVKKHLHQQQDAVCGGEGGGSSRGQLVLSSLIFSFFVYFNFPGTVDLQYRVQYIRHLLIYCGTVL